MNLLISFQKLKNKYYDDIVFKHTTQYDYLYKTLYNDLLYFIVSNKLIVDIKELNNFEGILNFLYNNRQYLN